MDDADMAQRRDENLAPYLVGMTLKPVPSGVASGECWYSDCGKELPQGKRWCNSVCRDNWENESPKNIIRRR